MQFIQDLDWHTLRLGAFNVLASIAERSLDTPQALLRRLDDILFRRVYHDDPVLGRFKAHLGEPAFEALAKRARKVRVNPAAEIMPSEPDTPWFHTVELWQADPALPSGAGPITEDHSFRYLDLGIKLGLLTPTYALSERGELLRAFYERAHGAIDATRPRPNPLVVTDVATRAVLIEALLREDVLFPLLLEEFCKAPDAGIAKAMRTTEEGEFPGLLLRATRRLIDVLGAEFDVHTALDLKRLREYEERISQKKNHLNQSLPRMEWAVDLGLIARPVRDSSTGRDPVYRRTDTTQRFRSAVAKFGMAPEEAQSQLDDGFVGAVAEIFGLKAVPPITTDEQLLWFCRGYKLVRRPAGFTPGRSAAFAGAMLALEAGRLIETNQFFDAVYGASRGQWSSYLGFSGGSRFDREFLIRVDDQLEPQLAANANGV
jgi:hypothetical protein